MHVVDSSCWIEYFLDSPLADLYGVALEDLDNLLVPTIALYEVHKRMSKLVPTEVVLECMFVMQKAHMVPIEAPIAILASQLSQQHNLAMADAMMYACAAHHNATFWTQDVDYQHLPNVRYHAKTV